MTREAKLKVVETLRRRMESAAATRRVSPKRSQAFQRADSRFAELMDVVTVLKSYDEEFYALFSEGK
jgi:hypothetical protein